MAECDEGASLPQTTLLVEDNPGDARLVEEVSSELGLVDLLHIVSTGSDALDFVNQRGDTDVPPTDLIILDWHLPDMDGEAVLEALNSDPAHNHIPVLVTTGTVSEQEVRNVYEKNANVCIMKPAITEKLKETIQAFEVFWLSTARLPSTDAKRQ